MDQSKNNKSDKKSNSTNTKTEEVKSKSSTRRKRDIMQTPPRINVGPDGNEQQPFQIYCVN